MELKNKIYKVGLTFQESVFIRAVAVTKVNCVSQLWVDDGVKSDPVIHHVHLQ